MADIGNIIEVTAPVEFEIIDDRLHFVLISGKRRHPFSISFHKARNAAHACMLLLDDKERTSAGKLRPFAHKAARERGHG